MTDLTTAEIRQVLLKKKHELDARLERITENLRRGVDPDSKERAKEMEDNEVIDALGNEARSEVAKVSAALRRLDRGEFGTCTMCGTAIDHARLLACPYAEDCIDCARLDEYRRAH